MDSLDAERRGDIAKLFEQRAQDETAFRKSVETVSEAAKLLAKKVESFKDTFSERNGQLGQLVKERQAFNENLRNLRSEVSTLGAWFNERADERARGLALAGAQSAATLADVARTSTKEFRSEIHEHVAALDAGHEKYAASLSAALAEWKASISPRLESLDTHLSELRADVGTLGSQVDKLKTEIGSLKVPFAMAAENTQKTVSGFAVTSEKWMREIADAARPSVVQGFNAVVAGNGEPQTIEGLLRGILEELRHINNYTTSSPAPALKNKGLFGFWRE